MLGEGLLDASSAAPIQRWALSRSGCGDRERTQHPYVEVVGVHQLAGLADGRPPLEHRLQGDATFEPGQRHPEAVMEAVTERDVLSVWAVEHESVGVGEGIDSRFAAASISSTASPARMVCSTCHVHCRRARRPALRANGQVPSGAAHVRLAG